MPTYQYRCTACSEPLEVVQTFTEAPRTECPTCGGTLRKVFSAVGVVFKGSGFYKNDSRPVPKGETAGAAKEGDPAKSAAAKGDGGAQAEGPSKSADKASKADKADKAAADKKADKPAKKQPGGGAGNHKVA